MRDLSWLWGSARAPVNLHPPWNLPNGSNKRQLRSVAAICSSPGVYQRILDTRPDHSEASDGLGVFQHQRGLLAQVEQLMLDSCQQQRYLDGLFARGGAISVPEPCDLPGCSLGGMVWMVEFDEVKLLIGEILQLGDRTRAFGPETPLLGSIPEFDSMAGRHADPRAGAAVRDSDR